MRKVRLHFRDAPTASVYAMVDVNAINATLAEALSHMRGGAAERESAAPSLSVNAVEVRAASNLGATRFCRTEGRSNSEFHPSATLGCRAQNPNPEPRPVGWRPTLSMWSNSKSI